MTDLTPTLNTLLTPTNTSIHPRTATETADEFLKEAYRINTHITSLLSYLHQIRKPYLTPSRPRKPHSKSHDSHPNTSPNRPGHGQEDLSDTDRDKIDTSTTHLLQTLSTSLTNLSSAESLRQETETSLLRKKYGHGVLGGMLFRWAGGHSPATGQGNDEWEEGPRGEGKNENQHRDEEIARMTKSIRESILWFLRRGLENAVCRQRDLVERRIERVREKERSVLYKSPHLHQGGNTTAAAATATDSGSGVGENTITKSERQSIESQLTPQQLQLFAEENSSMLNYYEDTLSKVQNTEKSLLEISSLQQSLVSHLSTQEDYIGQLVGDVADTQMNVGEGNRELKRAGEKRSSAMMVFWGTVGLCFWLVVWDLIF